MVISQRRNACHEIGEAIRHRPTGPPQDAHPAPACEDRYLPASFLPVPRTVALREL